ncbi:MAG: DUF4271 domain-containing protein [Flavobacteriaceae bacterium]|nr:MAG: DUF4271 domain-containing protein [Flavobacteriaceae bacterium]
MEATERVLISRDWVTLMVLVSFFFLALLKFLNQKKLRGYFLSFLNKSFIESDSFENSSFFSVFNIFFSVFSSLVFSLFLTQFLDFYKASNELTFLNFLVLFCVLFLFQLVQNGIQVVLVSLFSIKSTAIDILFVSQRSYLFSGSILMFILFVLYFYTGLNFNYILFVVIAIISLMSLFYINTNKKLIINKLFYFILYLCAIKLAPLLVLIKLIL